MRLKNIALNVALALSLLSTTVYAANTAAIGCPAPDQISTYGTGIANLYSWMFVSWYGGGTGLGGSQVGSLVQQSPMAPGSYICTYNTNLTISKADIYKKINELPVESRSKVQYLQGSNLGFIFVVEIVSNK